MLNADSIMVLSGAGLSSDSGIPTFRGKDGIWKVGSKNYFPEEMATFSFFRQHPEELWRWYDERKLLCAQTIPNPGHHALVKLEQISAQRETPFLHVTQNVDDLLIRAGAKNLIEIHGNIFKTRCSNQSCEGWYIVERKDRIGDCEICGSRLRPHVLWFDEVYDEHLFRSREMMGAKVSYFSLEMRS